MILATHLRQTIKFNRPLEAQRQKITIKKKKFGGVTLTIHKEKNKST